MNNMENGYNSYGSSRVSKFWVTIFSFIPGAGHMYLGLMKKGLQFMVLFFGVLAIGSVLNTESAAFIISSIVWFYSFFDCYHSRKKVERGEEITEEDLFIETSLYKLNPKHIGAGLVILGGILLFQRIIDKLIQLQLISIDIYVIRSFLAPLVLIGLGLYILKKTKIKEN
ncbi:hypothetical protein CLPU_16c00570 [Gottschalkia purinilytica]|uniref:TM2 domain-containing protein n=1 Tax=Gottschalkia purinilytica TaxID=1503 RepID=A0A0L0W7T7_GOTPU|nr:hypothetical protein [Gottschalkia purinilytica]KNF07501.1 hypothetical protein CLPU_16c00570 [Gottschalkia purinilytica]